MTRYFCDNPNCKYHLESNLDELAVDNGLFEPPIIVRNHRYYVIYGSQQQVSMLCDDCIRVVDFIGKELNKLREVKNESRM